MKYFAIMMFLLLSGCAHNTEIYATKNWEGHFKTIDEFKHATENMTLQKNESIWVLSDRTLNRVLKNTER